jgi:hypothetical protein
MRTDYITTEKQTEGDPAGDPAGSRKVRILTKTS